MFERKLMALLGGLAVEMGFELRIFLSAPNGEPREIVGEVHAPIFSASRRVPRNVRDTLVRLFASSRANLSDAGFESYLAEQGTSLVFFGSLNRLMDRFTTLPFFMTLWDFGHRDLVDFPEFRGKEWFSREARLWRVLPRASCIFVDSSATAKRITDSFGVSPRRVSTIGLLFEGFDELPDAPEIAVPESPYFIYPAKMWPHKNHLMLLEAFRGVLGERPDALLVLTGAPNGDCGGRLNASIDDMGIRDSVHSLGFVDERTLCALIRSARGLMMPTLLGPTNIPPLQALSLGTPAVISDVHLFDEGLNEKMVILPPENVSAWTSEMLRLLDEPIRREPVLFSNEWARREIGQVLSAFFQREKIWRGC